MRKSKAWGKRLFLLCLTLAIAIGMTLTAAKPAEAAAARLSKSKMTLYVGDSSKLTVKGTSKAGTFRSSRPSVASVTKAGTVKAKKAGTCTVTVKVGKKSLKCKVTVKKTLELSKYLNKNYTQLKKDAGKMKIKTDTPIQVPMQNYYVSTTKDPYGFAFWANTKTKKLQTLQNTDRKNITLYGVKLGEKISSADKKLKKKGFKLTKTNKINNANSPRKEVRTYQKGSSSITVSVTKTNKVEYYQWHR